MPSSSTSSNQRYHFFRLIIFIIAILIAILIVASFLFGLHDIDLLANLNDLGAIEASIRNWGIWGPVASIGLMIAHSFLPFPAELVALANGALYGAWLGSGITWIGAMLGAILAYWFAKLAGRPTLERLLSDKNLARIDRWNTKSATAPLLFARLIPIISFNLVNFAAGLAGVTFWTFFWTTAIGILPATIFCSLAGKYMLELNYWIWFGLIGIVAVLWFGGVLIWKYWIKSQKTAKI